MRIIRIMQNCTLKKPVCVNLSKGLIEKIDLIRGDVSRSRMVERALCLQLGIVYETSKKVGGR